MPNWLNSGSVSGPIWPAWNSLTTTGEKHEFLQRRRTSRERASSADIGRKPEPPPRRSREVTHFCSDRVDHTGDRPCHVAGTGSASSSTLPSVQVSCLPSWP